MAGAFVAASCGPVAHDVSLLNQVSTAFCLILRVASTASNSDSCSTCHSTFLSRNKFSGRPHPSHVFPNLATLLHDVQLAREVTPCLTCVVLRSILVCFINPYSWCALTKLKCRSNPNPSRNGFRARSLESHVCETAASNWGGWDTVTFDLDRLSVLSRPRWTRCMSQQLRHSACGPTNMATAWNT